MASCNSDAVNHRSFRFNLPNRLHQLPRTLNLEHIIFEAKDGLIRREQHGSRLQRDFGDVPDGCSKREHVKHAGNRRRQHAVPTSTEYLANAAAGILVGVEVGVEEGVETQELVHQGPVAE